MSSAKDRVALSHQSVVRREVPTFPAHPVSTQRVLSHCLGFPAPAVRCNCVASKVDFSQAQFFCAADASWVVRSCHLARCLLCLASVGSGTSELLWVNRSSIAKPILGFIKVGRLHHVLSAMIYGCLSGESALSSYGLIHIFFGNCQSLYSGYNFAGWVCSFLASQNLGVR